MVLHTTLLSEEPSSRTSAVIAGSYGTAWHFHRSGKQSWRANDIDVWLFEHEAFECATRTLYEHAARFETHLAQRGSDLHNLDEQQIEEYECETVPEILSARKKNWRFLSNLVQNWVPKKSDKTFHDCCFDTKRLYGQVADLLQHCMMPRRYAIAQTATFTMFPIRNKKTTALSRLPKINLIHVFFTSDIASTADLQEIICSGFDLSCCCVSLTVDEMLHVNLRYHCDADIHLPKMQTTLLPCAFGAPSNCIHILLAYFGICCVVSILFVCLECHIFDIVQIMFSVDDCFH